MTRYFFLPECANYAYDNDKNAINLLNEIKEINWKLEKQKSRLNITLYIQSDPFDLLAECFPHARGLVDSVFLDSASYFQFSNHIDTSNMSVYVISDDCGEMLIPTNEDIFRLLGSFPNKESYCIRNSKNLISILLRHKFNPSVLPELYRFSAIDRNLIVIEVILITYVQDLFDDYSKFELFKISYLETYRSFNWLEWVPTIHRFPFHSALDNLRSEYKNIKTRSEHLKWGYLMAILNGGIYNSELTLLNSRNKRVNDIFQFGLSKGRDTIFCSTDTENGNLEIYNYQGIHINSQYGLITGEVKTTNKEYTIECPEIKWLKT